MQQDTIQQLDDAVSEVFSIMLNRQCTPGKCDLTARAAVLPMLPQRDTGCVSAEVRFSGSMHGSCSIHLAERGAQLITGQLLGDECIEQLSMTKDAAGELCNIIAGSWKSRQSAAGSSCAISAPSVESGRCCMAGENTFAAQDQSVLRTYQFEDHCLRLQLTIK